MGRRIGRLLAKACSEEKGRGEKEGRGTPGRADGHSQGGGDGALDDSLLNSMEKSDVTRCIEWPTRRFCTEGLRSAVSVGLRSTPFPPSPTPGKPRRRRQLVRPKVLDCLIPAAVCHRIPSTILLLSVVNIESSAEALQ